MSETTILLFDINFYPYCTHHSLMVPKPNIQFAQVKIAQLPSFGFGRMTLKELWEPNESTRMSCKPKNSAKEAE